VGYTLIDEMCNKSGRGMANGLIKMDKFTEILSKSLTYFVISLECPSELANQSVE
jgi:hypothetical protein